MYDINTAMYDSGTSRSNPFVSHNGESTFLSNVVFGSLPIGNPADISLNVIEHIMDADIILVESHREFARLITRLNALNLRTRIDLQPGATIYQYQYESDPQKIESVNGILVSEAKSGKNIFVVSDEGCSVFLEPALSLKNRLIHERIRYSVLPGPFSGFSAITNTDFKIRQFLFGESLPAIPKEARIETYHRMRVMATPTVFLLTAVDARWCIQELCKYFPEGWTMDLQMSLTMKNETHTYGSPEEILDYIDRNIRLFASDNQEKKFAVLLYPDKQLQINY